MRLAAQDKALRECLPAIAPSALDIIAVRSGLGARDPGTAAGPAELGRLGLARRLEGAGRASRWIDIDPPADVPADAESRFRAIYRVARRLADEVERSAAAGRRFLVLGGDHSIAAGTWSGAANAVGPAAALGLVWIDAHMDAHTPESSHSGNWHGMPLAHLLGAGRPELAFLARTGRALLPANVCLVGARSYEPGEQALLARLGVRVVDGREIARRGLSEALDEAFAIASRGTERHGLSIDIDVIDPAEAPGTGAPVPGGLVAADLVRALRGRAAAERCLGLEVVELNPALDRDGRTAALVLELVASALGAGQG